MIIQVTQSISASSGNSRNRAVSDQNRMRFSVFYYPVKGHHLSTSFPFSHTHTYKHT